MLRLQYVALALVFAALSACGPQSMSQEEAINVALSHAPGAQIVNAQRGTMAELAPASLRVDEPNRLVWAITMRGTWLIDCKIETGLDPVCPPEPRLGLLLVDAFDGSFLASSVISVIP